MRSARVFVPLNRLARVATVIDTSIANGNSLLLVLASIEFKLAL